MMTKHYFWIIAALACFSPGVVAQVSSGTAFAVAPGLLVTNQHVIDGCSSVEIISADGRRTGSIVDADAKIDLALLRVSGLQGATARLRSPRNVRLGESVMVFGFPLAGSLTSGGNFTSGLVSGLRGLKEAAGELQITAPVQPGNSGGPLMDASGLVIGVVEAKLDALRSAIATGDIPQNVNFAISLEVLADFLAKNRVAIRDGAISPPLDTARVAELAQSFTYRVECRSSRQEAGASPSMKQGRPLACSGSHDAAWTNCFGEITFPSGAKYVGEWRDDKFNGQGTFTFSDGEKYIGEFKDDKRSGQGTRISPDGSKYVGEWKDDKANGQGTLISPDGSKYVGEWKDDRRSGQGILTFSDGTKYVGEWKDGHWNGRGTATYSSGHEVVGEFKGSKPNGQGTLTFPDGSKYVGEFKDGRRHGRGIEYRADGSTLRSGIWENHEFVGPQQTEASRSKEPRRLPPCTGSYGATTWTNCFGEYTSPTNAKYIGEWKNDKYNGQGIETFPDGRKYVGEFRDGKYNGLGTATFRDGRKYAGEWKDDKQHGQGIEYSAGGSILRSGIWQNDALVRGQ